ncbi:beta-ketoacyl-[acyl-carrier-protein] synthase family protein [Dactylosporangium vinaceum]|uniref:3-oxoacyl-[acyl-carrier-protein] synthase 2 n=2 Tax=Dactylosporangium TaxID=35753 RepID=A0A9W6KNW3_9ACTN|nr:MULTISPECIES: beta-ketoacyl-[acyl-carrier-protein] synthase family protein [Dactylosporangium]UAC02320.1 beta-ketoacyl-[acyl-carrier-protein] synthase family protein [Dactylosporangium vinaceum]UWZ50065.1 beta-ketoacyl-[acyl-carrier-protein] synthase family protein [Dactylosporangium matsuzakiense]GLL04537.1 3-oxoacyl-ACP synthase [Dactylosporangium matsuzakiense]
MGALSPLGGDVDTLWQGLLEGRSGVGRIDDLLPGDLAETMPVTIGARMAVSPDTLLTRVQARRMDRCEQAALVAAQQAWQHAGAPEVDGDRLAVAIGTGIGGVNTLLAQDDLLEEKGPGKVSPLVVPMLMPNGPAAWVSIEFGAHAGVYCPVSACASGAEAIALGARLIRAGEADMVIAGGSEAAITPLTLAGFAQARTLSKRNDDPLRASRPFDADRDGFVMGEGAGILILERAEHAAARGATVHGRLAGVGVTSDAYHITGPDPSGAGQVRAIRRAVADAGLQPSDVAHVNCHATSTVVGDVGEAVAIRQALGDDVVLTAPKSALGHLVGAAGAVESIVTLLSVAHGVIPPTLNLENKAPEVALDVVAGRPRELAMRAAVCNSFGFGGLNVSLLFTS